MIIDVKQIYVEISELAFPSYDFLSILLYSSKNYNEFSYIVISSVISGTVLVLQGMNELI